MKTHMELTHEQKQIALKIYKYISELTTSFSTVSMFKAVGHENVTELQSIKRLYSVLITYSCIYDTELGRIPKLTFKGLSHYKLLSEEMAQKTLTKTNDTVVSETNHEGVIILIGEKEVSIHHSMTYDKTDKVVLIDKYILLAMMSEINQHRVNVSFNNFISDVINCIRNCNDKEEYERLIHQLAFDTKLDKAIETGDLSVFEIK